MIRLKDGISEESLESLYADPLMARTGDDFHPAKPIDHPLLRYVSVFDDDEFMGAYIVIRYSECEREVHMLLHKKATLIARRASWMLVDGIFKEPSVMRVTAWVMATIPTAVNHCKRIGFQVEGVKRSAVMVNGRPENVVLLGVTRDEFCR